MNTANKKACSGRKTSEPTRLVKPELSYNDMESLLDVQMLDLFNSFCQSVGHPFSIDLKSNVTRARRIVSSWSPQKYEATNDPNEFMLPYILSQFFDRWISVEELAENEIYSTKCAVDFLDTNSEGWNVDEYALSNPELKPLLDKMTRIIGDVLDSFNLVDIYSKCKHGPNRTKSIPFDDAYLDVKDMDLNGTVASLQQFKHYLLGYAHALREAMVEESDELRAFVNADGLLHATVDDETEFTDIPKKFDSRRGMCPELTIPAFFGQGVGGELALALRKVGIDLKTQPEVHRNLARIGSVSPAAHICTVDWTGASNRIWTALCSVIMSEGKAPRWFDFIMNVCRSTHTRIEFNGVLASGQHFETEESLRSYLEKVCESYDLTLRRSKGRSGKIYYTASCRVRASMIGTMGNAVTFPLQTLIFYSFLTACNEIAEERIRLESGPPSPFYDIAPLQYVSAFGDDGITDSRSEPEIVYFAELLNWKLNVKKTFFNGAFRESCGGDYFMGRETRALEFKRPPTNPRFSVSRNKKVIQAWSYIVANATCSKLHSLGMDDALIYIWLAKFHESFKLGKVCVVPPSYPDGSGLRVNDLLSPPLSCTASVVKHLHDRRYLQIPPLDYRPPLEWGTEAVAYGLNPNRFHIPWFHASNIECGWVFKYLSSRPGSREPLQEWSYYCSSLEKPRLDDHHENVDADYRVALSFFDAHKTASRLDSDGEVKIKECRLIKVTTIVLSWV